MLSKGMTKTAAFAQGIAQAESAAAKRFFRRNPPSKTPSAVQRIAQMPDAQASRAERALAKSKGEPAEPFKGTQYAARTGKDLIKKKPAPAAQPQAVHKPAGKGAPASNPNHPGGFGTAAWHYPAAAGAVGLGAGYLARGGSRSDQ